MTRLLFLKNLKEILKNIARDISKHILHIGAERGAKEATFDSAMVMIKDFQLAIDDVVKKLNIKKEEFLEYINEKNAEK